MPASESNVLSDDDDDSDGDDPLLADTELKLT